MPVYNKGKYIKDALKSILMQETTYKYQILISDNASTDNSLKIAKEYQDKFPSVITVLESKKNIGITGNFMKLYSHIKTEYFCSLDADDYWISKTKIQDALNFLESHKDYTSYQGKTLVKHQKHETIYVDYLVDHTCDFSSFCKGKGATMGSGTSAIFRNTIFQKGIPDRIKYPKTKGIEKIIWGDSFRNFIALHDGKAYHSSNIDSIYRHHGEGEWSSLNSLSQNLNNAFLWRHMWDYFDEKYTIFLYVSLQLYLSNKNQILNYLDSIEDKSKLPETIKELVELEELYNQNMQNLVEFQNSLQANN